MGWGIERGGGDMVLWKGEDSKEGGDVLAMSEVEYRRYCRL